MTTPELTALEEMQRASLHHERFPCVPLPSPAKLIAAAEKLKTMRWEVKRLIHPAGKISAAGFDFASYDLTPLPPESGTAMDYAKKIVIRATIAKAEALTPSMICQITSGLAISHDNEQVRDYLVFQACKEVVLNDIIAIAKYGAPGPDGRHLPGSLALLSLIGVEPSITAGMLASASCASTSSVCGTAGRRSTGDRGSNRPIGPSKVGPPSKAALLKAIKYVTSNALCLTVRPRSLHPLSLELCSGDGFKRRFVETLDGSRSSNEDNTARALVLKSMVEVVENANMSGLRAWLPDVDINLLFDNARQGEVLNPYQVELNRQIKEVVQSTGALGLSTFPGVAYIVL